MLGWLSAIGDAIATFLAAISSYISGIISVFGLMTESFVFFTYCCSFAAPPVLVVFMTCAITICIVFLFIGR